MYLELGLGLGLRLGLMLELALVSNVKFLYFSRIE